MRETMKKMTQGATRLLVLALGLGLVSTGWAAAPTPVAEWNGDLANGSTKGKYTMSVDSGDSSVVSFSDYKATLSSSTSVASKGVQISWPDPTGDAESFTSKKMSVVIQYSGLSIPSGNTSLLGLPWNSTTSEYLVYSTSGNGKTCLATGVTSGGAGSQFGPSVETSAPTKGKMLVTFSGDSSCRPGVDLYFSTYNDATSAYGDYVRIGYWSDKKIDNGTFYGLKVGGTIASTGKYFRPGMTVEAVQIYDDVVAVDSTASLSGSSTWSDLVWDKETLEAFPALLEVNVSDDATLDLDDATITAQAISFNIASGKTLTLEGTATIPSAEISVTGGGKLRLNTSNPGCAITVASGATMDIAVATVSCSIINNGTINADGCAFNGAVTCYGTMNTSGTVSFSSSVQNKFYSGSALYVVSGTTTCASSNNQIFSDGYVEISKGATLVNNRDDMFNWGGTVHVHVKGTLTMNQKSTVGANNYIHLYDGALIDGPTTHNGLFFNSGEGDIIAEEGVSAITAKIVKNSGTIKIETKEGATLSTVYAPAIATRTGNGLLLQRIVDATRWGGGSAPANYDGVELYSSDSHTSNDNETFLSSSFAGYLKITTKDGDYRSFGWVGAGSFNNPVFSSRPTLELAGDVRIYQATSDKPFTVKNLSGTGDIYNFNDTDNKTFKYIDTLQTKDTTYSGIVKNISSCSNCDPSLTVRGADDATDIYSLTLSGVSDTTAPLTIENKAKVVFSSTGKWSGGTVTVKNGGVLESQNTAAIAANLKVEEGATLKFASGVELLASNYDWTSVSTEGSVKVDLSAITPSATPVTLIASGVEVSSDKFTVTAQSPQRTATLSVDNGALKATFANYWRDGAWSGSVVDDEDATLYISQNSTLTVSEALSLGAVTVVKEGEGNVALTISSAVALTTGGWTIPEGVTVNTPASMSISGTVSGGGVLNIPANTTLAMDDVTCSTKVTVSGTLETSGTTTLSGANTSAAGSSIEVQGGVTTLSSDWQGLNSDITIASGATFKFGESLYGGGNYRYNCINPNSSATIDVSGTLDLNGNQQTFGSNMAINLRNGGNITTTTDGYSYASYYADIVLENTTLNVYGGGTIAAYIRMPDNTSSSIMVDDSATLTIASKGFASGYNTATAGGSITKTGAGTLDLTAITPSKSMTINAGKVDVDEIPSASVTINTAGTLELKCGTDSNDADTADLSQIGGTGTVIISTASGWHTYPNADARMLPTTLTLKDEVANALIITKPNGETAIGSLTGSKNIRSDWQDNGSDGRILKVIQSKDTEWQGNFQNNRLTEFKVAGSGNGGTLKLSATFDSTITVPLTVESTGSVNLTGTYYGAATVDGTFGGTGTLDGALTFAAGSTFKVWATDADGLVATGALTLPVSGKVTVDVSDLTIGANDSYSILTVESGLSNTSAFADLDSETHMLSVSSGTLYVVPIAATVTSGSSVTKCSSVDAAIGTMVMGGDKDAYVTVLRGTTTYTEEELAEYNVVYDSSDSTYSLAAAQIDSTKYGTLAKAIAAAASSGDTITLLRDCTTEDLSLSGKSITFDEGSYTFTGSFTGSGTLVLPALWKSGATTRIASGWTGTVVLPNVNGTVDGFHFDYYGKVGSTIKIENGFSGWLNTAQDARQVKANLIVNSAFTISGTNSGTWYYLAKMSGTGNFSLIQSNAPAGFHILVLEDYSGTLSNTIGSGTPTALTVSRLNLAAAPVAGQNLINTTTPNAVNLGSVYVGDAQQSVALAKGSDGIYVALVSVTKGDNPTTYYATVSDAMTAAGSDAATITLLGNTDSNVSLAVGQSLVTSGFDVGAVSTSAEHCHVVNNAGVYTVVLDTYTITIPSVANTTVSVSYTSGGEAQVATSAGAITVDAGTSLTAIWTAVSGYQITANAEQTINPVVATQTLTSPTVEEMSAVVSNVNFTYGADYTTAEVTATIAGQATSATLTYGSNTYNAQVSNGTVTFTDVVVSRDSGNIYAPVSYTITTDAHATTGGTGSAVAADTTAWFSQSSANSGAPVNGSWTTEVNLSTPTNVSDNTFTATAASASSRVVLEFEVCFSSTSEEDVSGAAQAAIKLGEENSVTTFMVLTNGNNWAAVSAAGFTPNASATYNVVLTIDYGTNTYKVDVNGNSMTNGAGDTDFSLAANRSSVQNIDFAGSGTLTSMKGDQVEGYMVKDGQNHFYATIEAATQAYNSANGPYTVLHDGTAPSGWKIDNITKVLTKIAKGLFFMAY